MSSMRFSDRLIEAVERAGAPACVGLDPVYERIPSCVRDGATSTTGAIEAYCQHVLDAIEGVVGVVKLQSACFERYGAEGVGVLQRVATSARHRGLVVILDAKRGDIDLSAEHYAWAAFDEEQGVGADALTVNAYLGADTVEPYLKWSAGRDGTRGVFVLVRTSNPGSDGVQRTSLEGGRSVAEMMAELTARLGRDHVGEHGYSDVGAVVAATKPGDAAALRERMGEQIFLVPGYGAQGGTKRTVRALFHERGRGAIVTASRSVIYAFDADDAHWVDSVRSAAEDFADQIRALQE